MEEGVALLQAAWTQTSVTFQWRHRRDSLAIGSPATVRDRVAELPSAGVGELVCWMNFGGLPTELVHRSMDLFANEVMTAFRTASTTVA